MKRNPTVRDARELCNRLGARGVIVLAFEGTSYAGASYGMSRAECASYGKTMDAIGKAIEERLIKVESPFVSAVREGAAPRPKFHLASVATTRAQSTTPEEALKLAAATTATVAVIPGGGEESKS